jgi:hypothetical protein
MNHLRTFTSGQAASVPGPEAYGCRMPQRLTRIVLVAALMLGVIAMHAFGHQGHSEDADHAQVQILAMDTAAPHGMHHAAAIPTDDEPDAASLLALLGTMICGAILISLGMEWMRSVWSRIRGLLHAAIPTLERSRLPVRLWLPPPRLAPTGVQINRIAVLRI